MLNDALVDRVSANPWRHRAGLPALESWRTPDLLVQSQPSKLSPGFGYPQAEFAPNFLGVPKEDFLPKTPRFLHLYE